MHSHLGQRDQRDFSLGGFCGKSGIPNISRKRFPGWSALSCSQDSFCSLAVKGRASCSLIGAGLPEVDRSGSVGPEVESELGWGVIVQGDLNWADF
jgi:hypothetical protein